MCVKGKTKYAQAQVYYIESNVTGMAFNAV